jgi:hypothetical protein
MFHNPLARDSCAGDELIGKPDAVRIWWIREMKSGNQPTVTSHARICPPAESARESPAHKAWTT